MIMVPRPYQAEGLEALHDHVCTKDTNPCVVIPTGGGKSIMMAWAVERWKRDYPPFRVVILAHRQELVSQNSEELQGFYPGHIGVYAAGLGKRDTESSILYASIDSVARKAGLFEAWDCIIIDEAHRIPATGEGKYRAFIEISKLNNPDVRVIGFTATPFRMGSGPICHKDHILHEICYEANVGDLIRDGYLSPLRSRVSKDNAPDLTKAKRNHNGDYTIKSLSDAVGGEDVVRAAVKDAVATCVAEKRKSVLFFCVTEEHCGRVSEELALLGVMAPRVTSKTPKHLRKRYCEDFKSGRLKALCSINVFTEGFNAKQVDCVVLLRPTLSKGLYVQMVGRGFRLHPDKVDCLVLDYAGCIAEHGPIDAIDVGEVRTVECGDCGDVFSRAVRSCPHCGWTIPKIEVERMETEARNVRLHAKRASDLAILAAAPQVLKVSAVALSRHRKTGSPDSLKVVWRCGLTQVSEWVCLDHPGFAGEKATVWWTARFGDVAEARAMTVSTALSSLFIPHRLLASVATITVKKNGKFKEVVSYND